MREIARLFGKKLPLIILNFLIVTILTSCSGGGGDTSHFSPKITKQPVNITVNEADVAIFSVTADAYPVAVYQWKLNGVIIPGATEPTFKTQYTTQTDSGSKYSVEVSNDRGITISNEAILQVNRPSTSPFELRGFNFSAFGSDYWSVNADNDKALQFMKDSGANMIALDWLVQFANNGSMLPSGGFVSPPWTDIVKIVTRAKGLGMYVVLKPHVAMPDASGQNRHIGNTNTDTFLLSNFFPAWQTYLLDMTTQVPMQFVDAIAIGTELSFVDWKNRSEWASLIQALRSIYTGAITYDSMFSQYAQSKDIKDVVFWDLLDYISCSFYVRLTEDNLASVSTIAGLMRRNFRVDHIDAIGYLKQISELYNKRIVTLEGGYQSVNGALWDTNADYGGAQGFVENQDVQSRGLNGYLQALNLSKGSWLKGVSLWDVQPRHFRPYTMTDNNYRVGWGIYGKTSTEIVKRWYTMQ